MKRALPATVFNNTCLTFMKLLYNYLCKPVNHIVSVQFQGCLLHLPSAWRPPSGPVPVCSWDDAWWTSTWRLFTCHLCAGEGQQRCVGQPYCAVFRAVSSCLGALCKILFGDPYFFKFWGRDSYLFHIFCDDAAVCYILRGKQAKVQNATDTVCS